MDTYPNPKFTNPWPEALPVPLPELLDVLITSNYRRDVELLHAAGPMDAYLLPDGDPLNSDSGEPWFCAGIRHGEEGREYLSPMPDMPKALALWNKYAGPDRQITPAPWFTPVGTVLMVGCLRTEKTKDGYWVTREGDPDTTRYGTGADLVTAVGDYVTGYPDCLGRS